MAGLDWVVPVELLSRGGIGVGVVLVNVVTLLQPIVGRVPSVPRRRVDSVRAVRSISATVARFQPAGVTCIVGAAIDPTVAPMMRRRVDEMMARVGEKRTINSTRGRSHGTKVRA